MKILAVKLRQLGDTVLWTSALQELHAAFPDAEIHALVLKQTKHLLEAEPYLFKIHTTFAGSLSVCKKLLHLRSEHFDWLLGFHATTTLCRWFFLAGSKKAALHHHSRTQTPFFSIPVPAAGSLENALKRDNRVLQAMGISTRSFPPKLTVTEKETLAAREYLKGWIPKIALLPGASLATKRFPLEKWKVLIKELQSLSPNGFIMISDRALSQEWNLPALSRAVEMPLFDNLSVREVIALLNETHVALGNDSSLIHIAASLGKKTVSFFGPTCFGDWHPYESSRHTTVRVDVSCRNQGPTDNPAFRYCTLTHCDHLSCLNLLPIKEIVEKTRRHLISSH